MDYPEPFQKLIQQLRRLPSVGPRSAERMALWLLGSPDAKAEQLAVALREACELVRSCECCGFFSTEPLCELCRDPLRDATLLCVVETATDILPIERTGAFKGRYHALGGRLAPLEHRGPEDLRIAELLKRIGQERPEEVILALSTDVEGEATANYLIELLSMQTQEREGREDRAAERGGEDRAESGDCGNPKEESLEGLQNPKNLHQNLPKRPMKLSRLAQGLPAGGGLEHADALTLQRALMGRLGLG